MCDSERRTGATASAPTWWTAEWTTAGCTFGTTTNPWWYCPLTVLYVWCGNRPADAQLAMAKQTICYWRKKKYFRRMKMNLLFCLDFITNNTSSQIIYQKFHFSGVFFATSLLYEWALTDAGSKSKTNIYTKSTASRMI